MTWLWIALGTALALALLALLISFVCYRIVFFVKPTQKVEHEEYPLPTGKIYEPYHKSMVEWLKQARARQSRELRVTSHDGLRLFARYYEYAPGAPIEIMFHGYRGTAERDLSGGIARCFAIGHSVLLVDQRAAMNSDGHTISFGINERHDCRAWVDCVLREIDPNAKILLTGVSMGAATVLMAAAEDMPPQVKGVLADCGYTSAKEIIYKVARQIHVPARLAYPFIRLGARLFGHFDVDETSPLAAMASCRLPVLFFHGDTDDFVPCEMSVRNYEACIASKRLVITPGAGHGLCYPVDEQGYIAAMQEFLEPLVRE